MIRQPVQKNGYTLAELLVYAALLVIISFATINSLVILNVSFLRLRTREAASASSAAGLERIVREIRKATSVNDAQSIYDAHPGKLTLSYFTAGATTTVEFSVASSTIVIKENGGAAMNLTGQSIVIDSLIFKRVISTSTKAVKIELGLHDVRQASSSVDHYYTTAVLRGTY